MVAALQCHDEIKICRICIGWLRGRAGGLDVTPTLPVADMAASIEFFERAGFEVRKYDDGFAFASFNDESVFDLDGFPDLDPSTNHAGCYIITAETATWHERMVAAGLPVSPLQDEPWGMREFTLRDPDNNNIRIGWGSGSDSD